MPRASLFAADLLISQQLKDEQITEKELTDYTVGVRFAAGNNLALQLISPKRARTALDQQIWWSDPSKITKIKASLYERSNIGEFGYYQPGTHELKIGGIADPNEMLLYFGALAQNKSKPAASEEALETIYALSRPEQTEETILHEGLHAAWDIDVPQTEKDVIRAEVTKQLENNSIDIQTLAKKHPIYAQNITRAQGKGIGGILSGLFGQRDSFQEWVANEYFAHRGATVKYNTDYLYKMRSTSAVDEIVRKHIRWGKESRVNLKPEYIDPNVATGIMAGGVEPGISFETARKAMGTVWPGGTTVKFSGFDDAYNSIEGLGHKGIAHRLRKENTDFGSGWQGLEGDPIFYGSTLLRTPQGTSLHVSVPQALKAADELYHIKGLAWSYNKLVGGFRPVAAKEAGALHYATSFLIQDSLRESLGLAQKQIPVPSAPRLMSSAAVLGLAGGLGVIGLLGLMFSGKDDNYNTIEGLGHKGIAHRLRKENTDFGSGLQRLFGMAAGALKTIETRIPEVKWGLNVLAREHGDELFQGLNNIRQLFTGRSRLYHGTSAEAASSILEHGLLASKAGRANSITAAVIRGGKSKVDKRAITGTTYLTPSRKTAGLFARQQHYLEGGIIGPGPAQMLSTNPFVRQGQILSFDIPMWQKEYQAMRIRNPETAVHGSAEAWVQHNRGIQEVALKALGMKEPASKILAGIQARQTRGAFEMLDSSVVFRGSVGPERIVGSKSFKKLAETEWEDYANEYLVGTVPSESIAHVRKMLFSGSDDAWNTISGLQETGLASLLRKINTEFGSGWDKARALAKTILGKSELTEEGFTEFLGSNVFKKALRTAKKIGVLGKGGQGTATLMQAKFPGGQSLEFVKKQIRGFEDVGTEETLAGIVQERTAMRLMQDKGVPTLYGRKGQRTMYMEYIPGETSESILARGGQLTQNQINELQGILDTAHARGVAHGDIWNSKQMREMWTNNRERFLVSGPEEFELLPVNTLITPEGHAAVIDWGLSSSAMAIGETRTAESAWASLMKPNATPAQIDNLIIDALRRQEGRAPGYVANMGRTTSRELSAAKTSPKAIPAPKTAAEGARARRKLINSARDLKVAQAHISSAAITGARRHRSYNTGRGLEQINEVLGFAHTIPEDIGIAMTWPARR